MQKTLQGHKIAPLPTRFVSENRTYVPYALHPRGRNILSSFRTCKPHHLLKFNQYLFCARPPPATIAAAVAHSRCGSRFCMLYFMAVATQGAIFIMHQKQYNMKMETIERFTRLNLQKRTPANQRRRQACYEKVMKELHRVLPLYCTFALISDTRETEDALMRALYNLRTAIKALEAPEGDKPSPPVSLNWSRPS